MAMMILNEALSIGLPLLMLAAGQQGLAGEPADGHALIASGRASPFAGKTIEQQVRELANREEIRELISTYAHRAAHGISIADLFTDDGLFLTSTPGNAVREIRGRAALDEFYGGLTKRAGMQLPMIHNVVLKITGDEATGICSVEVRSTGNGKSMIGSGYYYDKYRRENGHWKFVERDSRFFHFVPMDQGWAEPATP